MPRGTATRPRPWPRVLAGLMPKSRRRAALATVTEERPAPLDLDAASVPAREPADNPRVLTG